MLPFVRLCQSVLVAIVLIASNVYVATSAHGQSILEQLEKRVRENLELAPSTKSDERPADKDSKPTAPSVTDANQKSDGSPKAGDSELPAPNRKSSTPPPLPVPSSPTITPAPSNPFSKMDTPNTTVPNSTVPNNAATESRGSVYLGLEAESLLDGSMGARVVGVTENSPAWKAGFQVNDVILAIDGYAIANLDTMVERLLLRRPGDVVKVLLMRGNRNVELTAVLQNASLAARVQGLSNSPVQSPLSAYGPAWIGVIVSDLSTAFRNQFGLRVFRAAAVTNVTKGSPAQLANIVPGDAIVAVDGQGIESARALLDWMQTKRPGEFVVLTVARGSRVITVELTLGVDPQFTPPTRSMPVVPDPFSEGNSTFVEPTENTVPMPTPAAPNEIEQLRNDLRTAREQMAALEKRIRELETQNKEVIKP